MKITDSTQYINKQEKIPNTSNTPNIPKNCSAGSKQTEHAVSVELSERGRSMARLADAFKTSKSTAKTGKKKKKRSTGDLSRALAIARRIMNGDKVPPKDESFLFRYNSDLYLKAKTLAAIQAHPKKHKSLLDENEEEESSESGIISPSAPESSEEGGDSSSSDEEV